MNEILGALGALERFGIAGLICAIFGVIIWKLFSMLEEKDKKLSKSIDLFISETAKNNESRREDAKQVTKAIDHLSTIVSLINNK